MLRSQALLRRDALIVLGCMLLGAWVHRHAFGAFFSSPEDLIHLQQAAGLRPISPSPFRYLSQVAYFRVMLDVFGPQAGAFHLVTFLLHLFNIGLVYAVGRAAGAGRSTAGLGAALFGSFPLFQVVVASAVGVNDELALGLALAALLLLRQRGWPWTLAAAVTFVVAMLSKESVAFLPLLAMLLKPAGEATRMTVRRLAPIWASMVVCAVLLVLLPPQGLGPYESAVGPHVFHNLMTYLVWSINVSDPMPDLVSSYDIAAWRVGMWASIGLAVGAMACRRKEPVVLFGLAWFLLGMVPILALKYQTYRHYLYPALPGLTIALATMSVRLLTSLVARLSPTSWPAIPAGVVMLASITYAVRAEGLVRERLQARVPGMQLALDPVVRRREVAHRAISSFALHLRAANANVLVLIPEERARTFGARSGKEYRASGGQTAYSLLEEVLDHGNAVRVFFPHVDTIAFVKVWEEGHRDWHLFLPYQEGWLEGFGTGPKSHAPAAHWMLQQGMNASARRYAEAALTLYPQESDLRLAYSSALYRLGERDRAFAELTYILKTVPQSRAGEVARQILASDGQGDPARPN